MLATKDKTVTASLGYEAGAWADTVRDWGMADATVFNFSEDKLFNDITRRLVLRRIRHEVRNNPYLAGLVAKFPEAVGTGQFKVRVGEKDYKKIVEDAFYRAGKVLEISGETFSSVQRIAIQELLITGEVFIVLLSNGKVQLVPSENCANPPTPGANCINGIERNEDGKPTGYWFCAMDQWGNPSWADVSAPVDARNVIHLYDRDRVAMGRGLPWIIASICTARDLYEITHSKTKQIKDANSISGVIKKNAPDFTQQTAIAQAQALATVTGDTLANTTEITPITNNRVVKLEAGTLFELEPGEDVTTVMSSYQAQDYNQLIMLMLHAISSPVGLPVELWFSGLGDVNYSGFKGLGVQWDGRRKHIIDLIENKFLNRFAVWWIQWNRKRGNLPASPDGYDDDDFAFVWRKTAVLDEDKEASARQKRLDTGFTDLSKEWEDSGFMTEEVLDARKVFWDQARAKAGLPAAPCPLSFMLKNELPQDSAHSSEPSPQGAAQ